MEINPRKVFERMFGQGGSAADRMARIDGDRLAIMINRLVAAPEVLAAAEHQKAAAAEVLWGVKGLLADLVTRATRQTDELPPASV